jgi:hypothetical protein
VFATFFVPSKALADQVAEAFHSIIKFLIVDIMQRQALRDIARTQLAQVGQVRPG